MDGWQTIIDAPGAQAALLATPTIADIPAGSPIKVLLDFSWPAWLPLAEVANLAGAEWWAPRLVGIQSDFQITDVHANGNTQIEIDGVSLGLATLVLAAAIAAAVALLGIAGFTAWAFVTRFQVQAQIAEQATKQIQIGTAFIQQQEAQGVSPQNAYNYLMGITSGATQAAQAAAGAGGGTGLLAGISAGTIVLVGIVLFLVLRK